MSQQQNPRRSRHLLDLDNPRPPRRTAKPRMGIEGVQKWVLSVLAVTTVWHMALALVIFATYVEDDQRASQIGLCVIAAAFGVLGVGVGLVIHRRPPFSPWLALGLLPGLIGLWLCLR